MILWLVNDMTWVLKVTSQHSTCTTIIAFSNNSYYMTLYIHKLSPLFLVYIRWTLIDFWHTAITNWISSQYSASSVSIDLKLMHFTFTDLSWQQSWVIWILWQMGHRTHIYGSVWLTQPIFSIWPKSLYCNLTSTCDFYSLYTIYYKRVLLSFSSYKLENIKSFSWMQEILIFNL